VRGCRHDFRREAAGTLDVAAGPAILSRDIDSLGPAQLLQALAQRIDARPSLGIVLGGVGQHSEAPHSVRLLRGRRLPHGEARRAADQRHDLAPPHSITSSARCWSCQGTSRPSALAVFMLITSSYLMGAWTGSSLNLAPLRMRSRYDAARR